MNASEILKKGFFGLAVLCFCLDIGMAACITYKALKPGLTPEQRERIEEMLASETAAELFGAYLVTPVPGITNPQRQPYVSPLKDKLIEMLEE